MWGSKFKKGDKVLVLNDLCSVWEVRNVFKEEVERFCYIDTIERVVLYGGQVYRAEDLTHYSAPIRELAYRLKGLEEKFNALPKSKSK